MALPTNVAPELRLLSDDTLAELRALSQANLPHFCTATADTRSGTRIGGALVTQTQTLFANVPCRLTPVRNRIATALEGAQPFQPDQWVLVFRVGVELPEGAIATVTGVEPTGVPWARVVRIGTPVGSRAFPIESRYSARDKLSGLPFSASIITMVTPLTGLAAVGNLRFRSAGALGTPAVGMAGTGDNGIFLVHNAGDALPAGSSFTRVTTATYVDVNGLLQTAAINQFRNAHYIGGVQTELIELSAKNDVKNNTATGAGAGVLPTGWSLNPSGGITPTVVGKVSHASLPGFFGVQFQVVNNTGVAVSPSVNMMGGTGLAATPYVPGNSRALSAYASASVLPGGATLRLTDFYWDSAGAFATSAGGANITPGVTPVRSRAVVSTALGTAAFVGAAMQFNVPANSTAVFEIYLPQDELGSFATSVIPTTGAAVTRAADLPLIPEPVAPQTSTWYTKLVNLGSSLVANGRIWQIGEVLSANGNLNSLRIISSGAGQYSAIITDPTGTGGVSCTVTIASAVNDVLEFFVQLFADGSLQLTIVNLTTSTTVAGGRTAGFGYAATWGLGANPVYLALGSRADGAAPGAIALITHKRARNLKTLAQMRAFAA